MRVGEDDLHLVWKVPVDCPLELRIDRFAPVAERAASVGPQDQHVRTLSRGEGDDPTDALLHRPIERRAREEEPRERPVDRRARDEVADRRPAEQIAGAVPNDRDVRGVDHPVRVVRQNVQAVAPVEPARRADGVVQERRAAQRLLLRVPAEDVPAAREVRVREVERADAPSRERQHRRNGVRLQQMVPDAELRRPRNRNRGDVGNVLRPHFREGALAEDPVVLELDEKAVHRRVVVGCERSLRGGSWLGRVRSASFPSSFSP